MKNREENKPPVASDTKELLRQTVLEAYREEYKDIADTWRNLEGKAQGAIAIAGIFIAAALTYIRELSAQTGVTDKLLLSIAVVSLVASVVCSILALKIREVAAPPMGEYVDGLVAHLLPIEDQAELKERVTRFFHDQATAWRDMKREADEINQLKAKYLWRGQLFLLSAILTVALLTVLRIWVEVREG